MSHLHKGNPFWDRVCKPFRSKWRQRANKLMGNYDSETQSSTAPRGVDKGVIAKGGTDRDEGQTTSFTWLEWAGGEVWRRRRPLLNVNVECGLTVGSSYTQAPSAAPSHPTHDHPLTNCKLNRHRKPEKDRQRRRLLT